MSTGVFCKIGVFDSGVGGLTVVAQIKKYLPGASITYIGDTARVPWGTRTPGTIIKFSNQLLDFLKQKDVSLAIAACHTASAVALPFLTEEISIPLIGVIRPTVESVIKQTRKGRVGIIATPATIRSGEWEKALTRQNPKLEVVSVAAPLLVSVVEEANEKTKFASDLVARYVIPFKKKKVDVVVLACTHYPLLYSIFKKELPGVKLINPGEETAKYIKYLLDDNYVRGRDEFYFTGLTDNVRSQVSRFFGRQTNHLREVKVQK